MESLIKGVQITSYGRYSSANYGLNTLCQSFGAIDVYYSYKTVVAFRAPGCGLVCSRNYWTPTTGKHLGWIQPVHEMRVDKDEFQQLWEEFVVPFIPRVS